MKIFFMMKINLSINTIHIPIHNIYKFSMGLGFGTFYGSFMAGGLTKDFILNPFV
jgi:hypothetical protein